MKKRSCARGNAAAKIGFALPCLLALWCWGCKCDDRVPKIDPFSGYTPSRFLFSILLQEGQGAALPSRSECSVPIRSAAAFLEDRSPQEGLPATLSRLPDFQQKTETDSEGMAAFIAPSAALYTLELATPDGLLLGQLAIPIEVRRTLVHGLVVQDLDDADGDQDRAEWVLELEILPDADGDGVSDSGLRAWFVFGQGHGLGFRHLGNGMSERVLLDRDLFEIGWEELADRDGDFVPDDQDPDADGDGIPDAAAGPTLACPAFSHGQLTAPGSQHEPIACSRCHTADQAFPLRCDDCHAASGRAWINSPINAPAGHFLHGCEQCHAADQAWSAVPGPAGSTHQRFPLEGKHLSARCFACHPTGKIEGIPTICESCHAQNIPIHHETSHCEACHTPQGFLPSTRSHVQFPLSGGHALLSCDRCHTGAGFSGLSFACASCHAGKAPIKHVSVGFSAQACDTCHNLVDWKTTSFTHYKWLLEGKHSSVPCAGCHQNNPTGYTGNQPHCSFCHTKGPGFPVHDGYGDDCVSCHTVSGWVPATRDNIPHAKWPLTGSHTTTSCATCHQNGTVQNPPQACSGCHAAVRPARHAGFFDGECSACHKTTTWAELLSPYQHKASFPLDGAHAMTTCAKCHPTTYAVSPACVDCHLAQRPANHYGNDCQACHTTANWNPTGSTNHHGADPAALPLTGGHAALTCTRCHTNGIGPLPSACASCHGSQAPAGHALDSCARCHTTAGWSSATQPPPNALHPMQGRHVGVSCVQCHGTYTTGVGFQKPRPATTCQSCHALPTGHLSVGTMVCADCHTVSGWVPAKGHVGALPTAPWNYQTWSGRWFPASPSPHQGAKECNKCHTDIAGKGYPFFSCTTVCHRSSLDSKHSGMQNYYYSPTNTNKPSTWPTANTGCVKSNCHPAGRTP